MVSPTTMISERFQIALNSVRSSYSRSSRRRVHVKRIEELYQIRVDGKTVWAPGIRRWRLYRSGLDTRLEQVARRYGLDGLSAAGDNQWVIDVGAYMGEWSLFMLRRGFNVLAIEPDPLAAVCVKRNLELHAPQGSRWELDDRVCVDDERKEVTFYSEPTNADGSLFPSTKHISKPIVRPSAKLDDIVAERIGGCERICALKMDAEGAEPEVLAGAPRLLRADLHIGIDAGYERQGASTVDECNRLLVNAGYSIRPSSVLMVCADKRALD